MIIINIIPTIWEQSDNKEYSYDIYSLLLKNRIIFLTGEINDAIANNIIAQMLYLDTINQNNISLYINSPGGSVTSGLAIYDTMNIINSKVNTIGIGLCASMGAVLLSSGNKRYALENCEIMIHEPLGGTNGQATDIKIHTEQILKIKNVLNKILSKNTKKPIKAIEKDTLNDKFMTSQEALTYGLIDEIIKKES